jgi:dolichol-phosphate mannosyltransferase
MPAYEEAANLRLLLPELLSVLKGLDIPFEVVVVDTETRRDDTPSVCAELGVTCVPRQGGSLYSHAVRTALAVSRGRWVVLMDADGSHAPSFVSTLWQARERADVVIASRYVPGGHTENPAILIFLSLVVNVVFRLVLDLECRDVSNSFRLYRGDDVRALTLECENFDVVEEILVRLFLLHPGYRVLEVPFTFGKRKEGRTKRNLVLFALGYLSTLWKLLRLKRTVRRIPLR